jgi:hypothetical protein
MIKQFLIKVKDFIKKTFVKLIDKIKTHNQKAKSSQDSIEISTEKPSPDSPEQSVQIQKTGEDLSVESFGQELSKDKLLPNSSEQSIEEQSIKEQSIKENEKSKQSVSQAFEKLNTAISELIEAILKELGL